MLLKKELTLIIIDVIFLQVKTTKKMEVPKKNCFKDGVTQTITFIQFFLLVNFNMKIFYHLNKYSLLSKKNKIMIKIL